MTDVPAEPPATIPEVPTVATEIVLLDQLPPVVASESVVAEPAQTVRVPDIAATVGRAFTVTTAVTDEVQPKPLV